MRGSLWTVILIALILTAVSSPTYGQALTVSPNCGTAATHFIVAGSGLDAPPNGCPDSCQVQSSVTLSWPGGSQGLFAPPLCSTSFIIDLQNVPGRPPGQECVACGLGNGTYTITFIGDTECSNHPAFPHRCVTATFEVRSAAENGDPWGANPMTLTADGETIIINYVACNVCDVAPCTSIRMIQAMSTYAEDAGGNLTPYTYIQQNYVQGAEYDSLVTPAGWRIDAAPALQIPYYSGTYHNSSLPIARPGEKLPDGGCQAAAIQDRPFRNMNSYQPSVEAIVAMFEVNVFCAAGEGTGQWLGRCTWRWRQSVLGNITITIGTASRGGPTGTFLDALALWASKHSFTFPTPMPPTSGGVLCN